MKSIYSFLWAPWRVEFIKKTKSKNCIFCSKSKSKNDTKNYVLYRGKYNFVMLNIYPYTNGHLMVAPYKHVGQLSKLKQYELHELFDITTNMVEILKKTHKIDGVNIGINIGRVAGAGIPGHLHVHIVPRWLGDTNFMVTIGNTKIISESLQHTYKTLLKEVSKL